MIRLVVIDVDGCLTGGEGQPLDFRGLARVAQTNLRSRTDPYTPAVTLCTGRPAPYVEVMHQAVAGHVPALYDAALRHPLVHALEHTFFMSAGVLYWWHFMSPIRSRARLTGMGPVLYMVSTKLLVGILGIVITFAPDALYAFYKDQTPIWGLSADDDQALAGAIMALEQSIVMGVALAWLFVRALAESESDEQRAERYA